MKKLAYLLLAVALIAVLVAYPGCGKKASNVQTSTEFSVPDVPTPPQSETTTQPQTEQTPQDQPTYEELEPIPLPDSEPCPT